jgi:hypothetical protein
MRRIALSINCANKSSISRAVNPTIGDNCATDRRCAEHCTFKVLDHLPWTSTNEGASDQPYQQILDISGHVDNGTNAVLPRRRVTSLADTTSPEEALQCPTLRCGYTWQPMAQKRHCCKDINAKRLIPSSQRAPPLALSACWLLEGGTPMPIKTMLVAGAASSDVARIRRATISCSTICAVLRFFRKPIRPV